MTEYDYFYVSNGDRVLMRDKTIVTITDVADPGEPDGEYQTISRSEYDQGREVITSSIPAETIFVGKTDAGHTYVSDLSEIVSIVP